MSDETQFIALDKRIKTNKKKLINHIEKMAKRIIEETAGDCAEEVAGYMKRQTLKKNNWLQHNRRNNLDQSGKFIKALNAQKPNVSRFEEGWIASFGNIGELNKVTRPAQTVEKEFVENDGQTKKVKFHFKKGTYPIWILAEFGSRDRKDGSPIMSRFGSFGSKGSNKIAMSFRLGTPKGSNKPIRYMYEPEDESGLRHKGQYPNKPFRQGLFKSRPHIRRIVSNKIREILRG